MPADQSWIARYQAAWFNSLGEGQMSLKPAERDIVRALRAYRPRLGGPALPSLEDLVEVTGRSRKTVQSVLENVKRFGLQGDAAP